ncbi:membrane progestin receptor beta-like [Anarhichas minor]|uniref:membrane progestin receptor beta-like n=1 Tax=Anarhichas minor TaxID=65739 RepID=UPI003F735A8C
MPRVSFARPSLCLTFLPLLHRLLPSLPPTVRDVDVPPLFRERFILSGYRPVGLPWRCYVLSLFQIHNETLNVWSHLLAAVCVALRFMMFTVLQGGLASFLHQVVLFLLSAFFFSFPVPERFSPGRYDIVGHGHQLFHVLLFLCTLAQQEALFQDFLWRRPALVGEFGEERLLLACASFFCLTLCCAMTALVMRRRARAQLMKYKRRRKKETTSRTQTRSLVNKEVTSYFMVQPPVGLS